MDPTTQSETAQRSLSADSHKEKLPLDTTDDALSSTQHGSLENIYEDGILDPIYHAKTLVLNRAIQEIGMGKYQYFLFLVAGFGWFADSVWPLITGLILAPVTDEFKFTAPFLSIAANAGLLVGAVFWGLGCDVWGRRWCFNITLFLAGVFGLAAGGSPNFVTLASLVAIMGIGVGGNLPVDSAVFLDLVPASKQYLLTFMSIFWCLGQLLVNLLAWPLISNFSCPFSSTTCEKRDNMGWRYLLFLLGGLTLVMWAARFFLFDLVESPRYLIGKGKNAEAVAVLHKIAAYNGTTSTLTIDQLESIGEYSEKALNNDQKKGKLSLSRTSDYTIDHVKSLFRTRKIAYSTTLLIFIWGIIGLASTLYNNFLPFILAKRIANFGDDSLNTTYRNTFIISVVGVPAAFLATWLVELPYMMYGILYAISPEIFPAKDRGTGNGLTAAATRVFGLIAPIIALYADLSTSVPVYIAGALVIFSGFLALLLPYEPRGKSSM